MARIVFVNSASSFDGASLRERPLGGAETVVVQLAETLAARGHRVTVLTGQPEPLDLNGVSWRAVRAGIGSLKERVRDAVTGLIGETDEAFAAAAVRFLSDEALWRRLH